MGVSTKLKAALNIHAPAAPEIMKICGKNKTTTKKNNTSPADAGLFLLGLRFCMAISKIFH